jgi:hypothetical protein
MMTSRRVSAIRRPAWRLAAISLAVLALAVAMALPALAGPGAFAQASPVLVHTGSGDVAVTVHRRSGILPTLEAFATEAPASSNNLKYGGGTTTGGSTIGVTTGASKVYLVYWGTQWGTESTGSDGYKHYSGDIKSMAPYQQAFFTGIGAGNETWSGVETQYCEGVATNAQTCPNNVPHVGYPTGGSLAGVWEDTSAAAPANATQAQIAAEAKLAADHFGNTTAASNRNAQYVITSPHGTHPDGFPSTGFCAWHDWASSTDGPLPYTNMPYVTDAGASCGQNFVNSGSAGILDGVSIVNGHEYDETITDQLPPVFIGQGGGWLDSNGAENADKCAWRQPPQEGAAQNVTLTTGTFAVQSTWGNDDHSGSGGCEVFHPIFSNGPDFSISASPTTVTVATGSTGQAIITTGALNGYNAAITLSVAGLPAGATSGFSTNPIPAPGSGSSTLTLDPGTAAAGTYPLTVTGSDGTTSHNTPVTLKITGAPSQLLGNPGFENGSGSPAPWVISGGVINSSGSEPPHAGTWDAWLGGHGTTHSDTLYQQVSIPSAVSTATLSVFLHIDTADATGTAHDRMRLQILDSSGTLLKNLASYSNLNAASGYVQKTFNLASFAGQTIRVFFVAKEDASLQTSFVLDDCALNTT